MADTSTAALNATKTRAELLLQVREGDRIEVLFAANFDARDTGTDFLRCLYEQVTLYNSDYQEWAHQQMLRYEREAAESSEVVAAAQYHEARLP